MNYGLYISASGVLTNMYRQDVLANNLANVDTVGFKPDFVALRQRDAARVEDGLPGMPSNRLLERLGAGALLAPNRVSAAQGTIQDTGNPLDAAINGRGYFVVSSGVSSGPVTDRIRLTRDGRFTIDPRGRLVMSSTGLEILDEQRQPITVNPSDGPVAIDPSGEVRQRGRIVGRLALVDADADQLIKLGAGLFRLEGASSVRPATGQIAPGSIERSAVDPIQAIMGVTDAAGSIANNARMIQLQDELTGRAIAGLARVT
jgi:flagellar basal body rod protein FlgG